MDKKVLGQKIRDARKNRGYTQQALASRADIGTVYLGEIERGIKFPSINSFIKLIEALGISADDILRDELTSGKAYVYDEIAEKLKDLTPKQRKIASDILTAYLQNLE